MEKVLNRQNKNMPFSKILNNVPLFLKENLLLLLTIFFIFLKFLTFTSFVSTPTATHLAPHSIFYYAKNVPIHLSFIVIFVSIAYLFKGKVQAFVLILMNFIISFLMLCDLVYYRCFQNFISIYTLDATKNLGGTSSSISSMLRPIDIIFFMDIILLLLITFGIKSFYKTAKRKVLASVILLAVGIAIPSYYHYRYDVLEDGANRRYFYTYFSPVLNISIMSPIGYHIHDIASYIENSKRLVLTEQDNKQISDWYKNKQENLPDNEYKAMFKGKNLIFVQVESLEQFLMNEKIENQEITPSLNKIIKNSLYFSQIHEQVSGGNSSDADLMANTSTHPVRSGATFFRYPDNSYNSMAVLMKKLGYYTSAFHPDGGGYWNWMPALQSMGFDKCTDTVGFKVDETIGYGLSDESFLRQLKDKIVEQPKPFYSFFVTLTSHMPFDMPEKTKELKLSDNIGKTVLGDYFQAVHYTDKQLGKFIDGLDQAGLLDNTVLVIYGDHTGVHKYYSDKLKTIEPKEDWWSQNNMTVPLIIYSKGMQGKEIKTIGGQVDILPTVAYLMGVDEKNYINTAMGRNLLKTNKNFTILSNGVYIGDAKSEEDKKNAIEALDISDKMLRSNYFKTKK